ncbi:20478_t:CDS:1, partial [Gigaspora margarita]
DTEASVNVTTKKKIVSKANITPEANNITLEVNDISSETNNIPPEALSNGGFVFASLYQAKLQASLATAFDDLDMFFHNDSSAVLSKHAILFEHDRNIQKSSLKKQVVKNFEKGQKG